MSYPSCELPGLRLDLPFKQAKRLLIDPFERAYLQWLLIRHPGNLSSASREAGLSRKHLRELIRKHALSR